MIIKMTHGIEVSAGRRQINGNQALSLTVFKGSNGLIVGSADDLPPETLVSGVFYYLCKCFFTIAVSGFDIGIRIGKGDIHLALAHHAHVLVKCVRENLPDVIAGFLFQIFHQKVVPKVGNRMGILRQIGLCDGIVSIPDLDRFPFA